MNWLDILIFFVIFTSVVTSIVRGVVRELISLGALAGGILFGLWYHPALARHIEPAAASPGIARFVAFVLILAGSLLAGWLIIKILGALIKAGGLGWADRMLGAAFGLARGVLISAAIVLGIVALLHDYPAPTRMVAGSRFAPAVLYGTRIMAAFAPRTLKDAFEQGWKKVRGAWRIPEDSV